MHNDRTVSLEMDKPSRMGGHEGDPFRHLGGDARDTESKPERGPSY